jgi:hypothetical protein
MHILKRNTETLRHPNKEVGLGADSGNQMYIQTESPEFNTAKFMYRYASLDNRDTFGEMRC